MMLTLAIERRFDVVVEEAGAKPKSVVFGATLATAQCYADEFNRQAVKLGRKRRAVVVWSQRGAMPARNVSECVLRDG